MEGYWVAWGVEVEDELRVRDGRLRVHHERLPLLRERVIARTEVWTGQQRSPYGAEVAFDEDR
jgi:hypothetical protein